VAAQERTADVMVLILVDPAQAIALRR
ncbi:MAG: hypothetical protein MOP51_3158, partial [Citricoccus sp.]|nr:hypothetical protein [Citricoccus sp. WCRC_4]